MATRQLVNGTFLQYTSGVNIVIIQVRPARHISTHGKQLTYDINRIGRLQTCSMHKLIINCQFPAAIVNNQHTYTRSTSIESCSQPV